MTAKNQGLFLKGDQVETVTDPAARKVLRERSNRDTGTRSHLFCCYFCKAFLLQNLNRRLQDRVHAGIGARLYRRFSCVKTASAAPMECDPPT